MVGQRQSCHVMCPSCSLMRLKNWIKKGVVLQYYMAFSCIFMGENKVSNHLIFSDAVFKEIWCNDHLKCQEQAPSNHCADFCLTQTCLFDHCCTYMKGFPKRQKSKPHSRCYPGCLVSNTQGFQERIVRYRSLSNHQGYQQLLHHKAPIHKMDQTAEGSITITQAPSPDHHFLLPSSRTQK